MCQSTHLLSSGNESRVCSSIAYGVPFNWNHTGLSESSCVTWMCLWLSNYKSVMNQNAPSENPHTFAHVAVKVEASIISNECRGCLRTLVFRSSYQLLIHWGSWENSSFVPYWAGAQLLVEWKMGHDEGFL